jgi:hypothetical protein
LNGMGSARLAAIPFFADLPEDELVGVARVAFEVEIPPGQAFASEGGSGTRWSPSRAAPLMCYGGRYGANDRGG